jgi:hypothetical protein
MLGIVPITGMTNYQYAPALTSGQKFNLMIRNYATPFPYLAAGFQAGISQAANNFEGYGQGLPVTANDSARRWGTDLLQVSSATTSIPFYSSRIRVTSASAIATRRSAG